MSSSSDLILPAGSTIVKAILYAEGYSITNTTLNTGDVVTLTSLKFKVQNNAYVTLNSASPGFLMSVRSTDTKYTQLGFDVTSLIPVDGYVSTVVPGGDPSKKGSYAVADLAPVVDANEGYGWCLMVVYTNPASQFRSISIADACLTSTASLLSIPNVVVPSSGTVKASVGVTGTYGDVDLLDYVIFGQNGTTLSALKDPVTGVVSDILNSTVGFDATNNVSTDGGPAMAGAYTARNPQKSAATPLKTSGPWHSFWYDADILYATGMLSNSVNPITVNIVQATAGPSGGSEYIGYGTYAVSIDIVAAELTKSLSPTAIADGGTATYTFNLNNTKAGSNNLTNIGFTDNLPSGLMVANPNGVVITGGSGGAVTAVPGSNTFTLSGFNLNSNSTASITLNVTNKQGQLNSDCSTNPAAFTNGFNNIKNNTANLGNGVTDQCLLVLAPIVPGFRDTVVCKGDASVFADTSVVPAGVSISGWSWDFGDGGTANTQNPSHTYANAGSYTVKLEVTDNVGRKFSVSKQVVVRSAPAVTISAVPNPICKGDSAQFTATGGGTYLWSPAASLTDDKIANPLAFPAVNTTYSLKVTDAFGCEKDTTYDIVVNEPANPGLGKTIYVCPSALKFTLFDTLSQSPQATGTWSDVNSSGGMTGTSATGTQFDPSKVKSGQTYQFKYTVKPKAPCADSSSVITVVVHPAIVAVPAVLTDEFCDQKNGTITINPVGGTSPFQYNLKSTQNQPSNAYTGLTSGMYPVRITDTYGCFKDTTYKLSFVPGINNFTYTSTSSTCTNPSGSVTVTTVNGGLSPYTYSGNSTTFQTSNVLGNLPPGQQVISVKDANGCIADTNVSITTANGPSDIYVTLVHSTCDAIAGSITIDSIKGGMSPFTYSLDAGAYSSVTVYSNLSPGIHTVKVLDANGCTFSKIITITTTPAIHGFAVNVIPETCGRSNGRIEVRNINGGTKPMGYSLDNVTFQADSNFTGLTSGSYTVYLKDNPGCLDNKSTSIIALPGPTASVVVVNDVKCFGDSSGSATISFTGGNGLIQTSWNTVPVQSGITATYLPIGQYYCVVSDTNGCTDTAFVTINQPTGLSLSISSTPSSCSVNDGTATAVVTGGTGSYGYSWNSSPVQVNDTASSLAPGYYTVQVTDSLGCQDTIGVSVFMKTGPVVALVSTSAITCADSTNGGITTVSSGGTVPYSYSWNTTPIQQDSVANGLGPGNYTLTVTDAAGCVSVYNGSLAAPPQITATTSAVGDPCMQSKGSVTVSATGGTGSLNYNWNTTPVQITPTATGLLAGNYTVVVSDQNGCSKKFTQAVVKIPGPKVTRVLLTNVDCKGDKNGAIAVTATSATAMTYTWTTNPVQTNATATGLGEGTYSCKIADANGCDTTITRTVGYQKPLPVFELGVDSAFCKNDSLEIGVDTIPDATYSWSNGGKDPKIYVQEEGYYDLIANKDGCLYRDTIFVRMDTMPNLNLGEDSIFCGEVMITLTITVNGSAYYLWENGSINPNRTFTIPDTYWAQISRNTCIISDTLALFTQPKTSVSLPADQSLCAGDVFIIFPTLVNQEAPKYLWNTSEQSSTISVRETGMYSVIINDGNCVSHDTILVTFHPLPEIPLENDEVCEFDSLLIDASCAGCISYLWENGATVPQQYVKPFNQKNIHVVDTNGCVNDKPLYYIQSEDNECKVDFFVPNTFTPNADGYNELFLPVFRDELLEKYSLIIFDRWGESVFETTDIHKGWDGLYKGLPVKSDVYNWRIVYSTINRASTKQLMGAVNLQR